jgi:hypothetical protein
VHRFAIRPNERLTLIRGKPLMSAGRDRVKADEFIISSDSSTPKDGLRKAVAAIDAGAFSRRPWHKSHRANDIKR